MPVPPGPISPDSEKVIRQKLAVALSEKDNIQQQIDCTTRELDVLRARKQANAVLIKNLKEDLPNA